MQRNERTAEYASPDEEVTYTTSKIDAAIDFLEATHGKPTKGRIPVELAKLRIPTRDGTVAFERATVVQVRDAARVAATHAAGRRRCRSPESRAPVEAQRCRSRRNVAAFGGTSC